MDEVRAFDGAKRERAMKKVYISTGGFDDVEK